MRAVKQRFLSLKGGETPMARLNKNIEVSRRCIGRNVRNQAVTEASFNPPLSLKASVPRGTVETVVKPSHKVSFRFSHDMNFLKKGLDY